MTRRMSLRMIAEATNARETQESLDSIHDPARGRWVCLALAALVVMGALLRVYRLDEQSIWWDEYVAGGHGLNADTLGDYLARVQFLVPDNVPFYYVVLFGWTRLFGPGNILGMRLLSVFASVSAIPLLFVIGRRLFGVRVGLIAAACLSASPSHIWLGQGIRPNALVEFLVLVSMYAMMRGCTERNRAWLAVATLANLLLAWSYFFGLLFVMTEFLYVALFWFDAPRSLPAWRRTTLGWWLANTLVGFSPYLWLRPHASQLHSQADDFFMLMPSPREILFNLFGYDAVMTTEPFL